MIANLEISFENGLLVFTQRVTPETEVAQRHEKFPSWPWVDLAYALGFFDDVLTAVDEEVRRFVQSRPAPRIITMRFSGHDEAMTISRTFAYCRCGNAWLKFTTDESGLIMELHRRPGSYKDFALVDVLDHLEGRAGRGRGQFVRATPAALRQKLWHALYEGPIIVEELPHPPRIPDEDRIRPTGR